MVDATLVLKENSMGKDCWAEPVSLITSATPHLGSKGINRYQCSVDFTLWRKSRYKRNGCLEEQENTCS
ncbi:hypothetical protein Leryth_018591 [Lithospermum erythrorhizon]|nr:hypothetical protein Leryth_018591 [Lithospermum erythrorhizon]